MILRLVVRFFKFVGKASILLAKSLPVHLWSPSEQDIDLLAALLKKELQSHEFGFAHSIIKQLPYSDRVVNPLLSAPLQLKIGMALLHALLLHKKNNSSYFSRSAELQQYVKTCKSIILKLQFHNDDGTCQFPLLEFNNPMVEPLYTSVAESISAKSEPDELCAFMVFAVTSLGNKLQIFNEIGIQWLEYMIYLKMIDIVVRIFADITPRLLSAHAILLNNSNSTPSGVLSYSHLIDALMYTDTKETFVGSTFGRLMNVKRTVGVTTTKLTSSICVAIEKASSVVSLTASVGSITASKLAAFWTSELVRIFASAEPCVLYTINEICATCLKINAYDGVGKVLNDVAEFKQFMLGSSSFFSYFSSSYPGDQFSGSIFSKQIKPMREYPFIALVYLITKANNELDKRTNVATTVLYNRKPFEKVAKNSLGGEFSIYRILGCCLLYSQALVAVGNDIDVELHSVMMSFWQLFFCLYFESIASQQSNSSNAASVQFYGYYFLDIASRNSLYVSIMKSLDSLQKYYNARLSSLIVQSNSNKNVDFSSKINLFKELQQVYYAMYIWVKDTKDSIDKLAQQLASLPPQYCTARLVSIMRENAAGNSMYLWHNLMDFEPWTKVKKQQMVTILAEIYPNLISKSLSSATLVMQKMLRRKTIDFESVKAREKVLIRPAPVVFDNQTISCNTVMKNEDFDFQFVARSSQSYNEALAKHIQVDNEYTTLLPSMYENKQIVA